ncbi:MAG TPA: TonB family protein [Noviherbaspirillum sp.]
MQSMTPTLTTTAVPDTTDTALWRSLRFGFILLLHAGFVFALQNSLDKPEVRVASSPKPVFVSFVAPPAPEPVKPVEVPKPPEPKPEPKPKPKPVVKPKPQPAPLPPSEKAIEAPKPEPAPPEPPPPAPAAAPVAPAARPAAPAPAPAPVVPRVVSSGVEYLYSPKPAYPAMSRRLGEEGTVVLRVTISERGLVDQIEVAKSSGYPRLDESALRTVKTYRFKPQMENGRAIPVIANIPVPFNIE